MTNIRTKALLLVGVGGQGTILASKILSEGLVREGYDVKMSEIHGMSQRGGSVTTQIKFGEKVASPIIGLAEADAIVAFEKVEAVRSLAYLKAEGTLLVNDHEIYPLPVLTGKEEYPSNVLEFLQKKAKKCSIIAANNIAMELGNTKAQNIVLLGALIKALGLVNLAWEEILKQYLPPKLYELNLKALQAGMNQKLQL
ncbi:MAG: indolepyruvate oxidoreductase subunit beta [Clostridia bacterium]|jgi:indolepyruvate ferredoxin oxidoreductase beta subunit|nr:indolepyruvate oxidoreductase subunit beta [Clostridia bacterium]